MKKGSHHGRNESPPTIIFHKGDEASSSSLSPVTFALEMRISTGEHFTPPLTSDSDWSAGCHGMEGGEVRPGRRVLAHRSVESGQRYESRRGAGALRPMRTVKVDIEVTVWLWNTSALAFSRQNPLS